MHGRSLLVPGSKSPESDAFLLHAPWHECCNILLSETRLIWSSSMNRFGVELRAEPEPVRPAHELDGTHTVSERATLIQLEDIVSTDIMTRKTKVICTLGPACGSAEGLGALIDAGLNIARLNFSHGDHESHYKMLQLFR